MNVLKRDDLEEFVKQGLAKLINTEGCSLEQAYQKGFEDAIKLIKDSIELI